MNHGFIKVAAAIPEIHVADCAFNAERIVRLTERAVLSGVQFVCFPELSVTGYTCADLFHQQLLLDEAEKHLAVLLQRTTTLDIVSIVGIPVVCGPNLYNAAVVIREGRILGAVPKIHLPNYNEFYEKRWFASGSELAAGTTVTLCGQTVPLSPEIIFSASNADVSFGIEICEDVWTPEPPSGRLAMEGAGIIFNLSASNEGIGKHDYLVGLLKQQSARCMAGYVYASAGYGESTTDVVFAGNGLILENGTVLAESERFSLEEQLIISEIDTEKLQSDRMRTTSFTEKTSRQTTSYKHIPFVLPEIPVSLTRTVEPFPFVPADKDINARCEEIFAIQTSGLAKRIRHTRCEHTIVGISGGLDSTLALLVSAKTCDRLGISRKQIVGITMPGFGTTDRTYTNALDLMQALGVTVREISIRQACELHFRDIGHDSSVHNVTYENSQARERTQILMDVANQMNGMVIGTGDLSELALGWATYNGDHMSMYGVNAGIPKTLVRHLVKWVADTQMETKTSATLRDILDTPVSPELLPASSDGTIAQKTEDIVGPYELHDFFLYYMIRFGFRPSKIYYLATLAFAGTYTETMIKKWLKTFLYRFFSQQFKRSCMPDGPKVGSINLSPRGDWRMPSDASAALWLKDAENI